MKASLNNSKSCHQGVFVAPSWGWNGALAFVGIFNHVPIFEDEKQPGRDERIWRRWNQCGCKEAKSASSYRELGGGGSEVGRQGNWQQTGTPGTSGKAREKSMSKPGELLKSQQYARD